MRINIAQLITAIQNAPSISINDRNASLDFLHNNVYIPLQNGKAVSLSDLDFSAFDVVHIRALWEMHDNNELKSGHAVKIANKLRGIPPACKPAAFV